MIRGIPLPGGSVARLVEAAIERFEERGYDEVTVLELAAAAGVTTGSLYHHFGSKLGLYTAVRDEMETRIVERMEGAAAALGGRGRRAVRASLQVAFDAAVRFRVVRILSEGRPEDDPDPVAKALRACLPPGMALAAPVLAAAWRGALTTVVEGGSAPHARRALSWALGES